MHFFPGLNCALRMKLSMAKCVEMHYSSASGVRLFRRTRRSCICFMSWRLFSTLRQH